MEADAGLSWGRGKVDGNGAQPEQGVGGERVEIDGGVMITEHGKNDENGAGIVVCPEDQCLHTSAARESRGDNSPRGSHGSELACVVEMEELHELLGQVKRAEAAFLLQNAQVADGFAACPAQSSTFIRVYF